LAARVPSFAQPSPPSGIELSVGLKIHRSVDAPERRDVVGYSPKGGGDGG
jgi:hypothetical protein